MKLSIKIKKLLTSYTIYYILKNKGKFLQKQYVMNNRRVTLKDISKLSTVHKALYDKKGISEATRKEILKVANEMDFRINVVASTLKRKAIRIAVVLPQATGEERYFYKDIWNGIDDASKSLKDFNIEIIKIAFKGIDYRLQRRILEDVYNEYSASINIKL